MMPAKIRDNLRDKLWGLADELGWAILNDIDRSRLYERWTRDPAIGGQIAHFMDPRKVRVYIKDSLIKPYERARLLASQDEIWRALEIASPATTVQTFIKPHGCRLEDGKIICWGKSRDWKLILMAAFERSRLAKSAIPFGVVLLETGKTSNEGTRSLVKDACACLGIEKLSWLE
ncbi:hypothetical protein RBA41_19485 [Massilia sp. CCM 9210]|uniref:hypothetical protein n=1 Tax=Massilia scottii TaxID=3057166 RepID=UPI00279660E9|nr:hypothetical protein [Massilia sp. CCM 9210]MDQ1815487.1 hypothetical protein [Massilia sp. CCM 9210]